MRYVNSVLRFRDYLGDEELMKKIILK